MRRTRDTFFAVALVGTLTLGSVTLGIVAWPSTALAGDEIPDVTPDQLETMMNAGNAVPIDANGASVRSEHGTVPDAVLLSDYKRYEPGSELPADTGTKLVFYCANTMCGAAPAAARKAQTAGYQNVAVMSEGIIGWAKAGKSVAKDKAS